MYVHNLNNVLLVLQRSYIQKAESNFWTFKICKNVFLVYLCCLAFKSLHIFEYFPKAQFLVWLCTCFQQVMLFRLYNKLFSKQFQLFVTKSNKFTDNSNYLCIQITLLDWLNISSFVPFRLKRTPVIMNTFSWSQ